MSNRKRRSYTKRFKLEAVRRMDEASSIASLADELGVERGLLYKWRDRLQSGGAEALRRVGRPRQAAAAEIAAPPAPVDITDPAEARRLIAELERKIGRQQLELDFFRDALRQVRKSQPSSGEPGGKPSSR